MSPQYIKIKVSTESHSISIPQGCPEKVWNEGYLALKKLLRDNKVPAKHWKRYDDVNLIELYADCPSDLAFLELWILTHEQWTKKYSPSAHQALYGKKEKAAPPKYTAAGSLWCIYTADGYGIGEINYRIYPTEEEARKVLPKDTDIMIVIPLNTALDYIHDSYWADKHKGGILPKSFFKSQLYRDMHIEGKLGVACRA